MKRDPLRTTIARAEEAYEVASHPPMNRIFDSPDDIHDPETDPLATKRMKCLQIGIDIKTIVIDFLGDLEKNHGSKRRERFFYFIRDGHVFVNSASSYHRAEIKSDAARLMQIIRRYRIDGKDL